jgi:hypothetical protein
MSVPNLSSLFQIGVDLLRTTVDKVTNSITAQLGDVTTSSVYSNGAEWWQQIGFASRPSQPKAGQSAAQGITIRSSDQDICIASKDVRSQAIYGNLNDGETCLYAGGSDGNAQGRILIKQDGSINLVTTSDNTDKGKSVMLRVAPDEILMSNQFGAFVINKNGIQLRTTAGAIINLADLNASQTSAAIVANQVVVQGGSIAVQGGSVALGANASPATPAGMCIAAPYAVPSTSVFISP